MILEESKVQRNDLSITESQRTYDSARINTVGDDTLGEEEDVGAEQFQNQIKTAPPKKASGIRHS